MLKKLQKENFNEIYSLLEVSFPSDERRDKTEQEKLFDKEQYSVYGYEKDEKLCGIIALWEFDEFMYIEHFAVNPNMRNGGIGKNMLSEIKDIFGKKICLEVEPPESDITKRRIGFYERNGFFLNNYEYYQPPMGKGKKSIPLLVMTTDGEISREEFVYVRNALYKVVYEAVDFI